MLKTSILILRCIPELLSDIELLRRDRWNGDAEKSGELVVLENESPKFS